MVLVVRLAKNKRAALNKTRELLETHGVPLYGTLANDLDQDSEGYGAGNYAEYYHTSASASPAQTYAAEPLYQPLQR